MRGDVRVESESSIPVETHLRASTNEPRLRSSAHTRSTRAKSLGDDHRSITSPDKRSSDSI